MDKQADKRPENWDSTSGKLHANLLLINGSLIVTNAYLPAAQNWSLQLALSQGRYDFLSAKHFYVSKFSHARTRERPLYSNFKTVRSEQLNAMITQNLLLAQFFL